MTEKRDVIIIGFGPAGMACAYKIKKERPNANVVVLEKGSPIKDRFCPARKLGYCAHCKKCAITHGSGGAGPYSDGKALKPNKSDRKVMGNLGGLMDLKTSVQLFEEFDEILLSHGAPNVLTGSAGDEFIESIRPLASLAGIDVSYRPIRAMGTDGAQRTFINIEKDILSMGVEVMFGAEAIDLIGEDGKCIGVKYRQGKKEDNLYAPHVVVAVGRAGINFMSYLCKKYDLEYTSEMVDIGFRCEFPAEVTAPVDEAVYELKMKMLNPETGSEIRSFCWCPWGIVTTEAYRIGNRKFAALNGQSSRGMRTRNSNFCILITPKYSGVQDPLDLAVLNCQAINAMGNGQPVIQRLGDFKQYKPTTKEEFNRNWIKPTSVAVPGNLSMAVPFQMANDLQYFLRKADLILPGMDDDDVIVGGPEIKLYNMSPVTSRECETSIPGLYGIGDGGGPTHGLTPAAVNGLYLGGILASKL